MTDVRRATRLLVLFAAVIPAACRREAPAEPPLPVAQKPPTSLDPRAATLPVLHPDETGFVARTHKSGTRVMPYRLFVPAGYAGDRLYPLVVWLHGGGGLGTDNLAQISGDQIPGTRLWITPEQQAAHAAFVLVPQSPGPWILAPWNLGVAHSSLQDNARMAADVINEVTRDFTIDLTRVYLLGQSMGGNGAWNLVSNMPDRFAAVILVCPVLSDISRATAVADVPLWIFVGETDSVTEKARALVAALKEAGGHPRYTEYPHMGHEIWTRVFAEPAIAPWLFAQARPR